MLFCPTCGNLLLVDGADRGMRFVCHTCPYKHLIRSAVRKKIPLVRKEVDDVLGGAEAWKDVDKTAARCPACEHDMAFFFQLQIRSADEPMTTFYKCERCSKQWSE
eukprot:PLAT14993.1.p1 GENE.PLAT14993.1~~PLAT14993.1.p1  ORF type:complete len:106 (+),score=36.70 PLAT14993.1:36-353(+)